VDLDGTLLGPDKLVTPRAKAALAGLQALGVKVVIATGRPLRTAMPVAEQLAGLDTVVAYNGAAMWHRRRVQVVKELDPATAAEALARLRTAPGVLLALETASGWFVDAPPGTPPGAYGDAPTGSAAHLFRGGPPTASGPLERFLTAAPIKLLAVSDEVEPRRLAEGLTDLDLYTTWSLPFLLEVHHREVDKSAALAVICHELGIDAADVAAFGDQHNDSGMLAWAGVGVAMGNAEPEALATADLVTADAADDGVAAVLESWLRTAAPRAAGVRA